MAGGMDLGTGGKRRSLDAQLNLVPFIDLMAVTIVFLIMSAVWTQLGKLNVAQSGASDPEPGPTTQAALEMTMTSTWLDLKLDGRVLGRFSGDEALQQMSGVLTEVKRQLPDQSAVTILSEDDVTYDAIVRAIDLCVAAELPSVTLNPK